MLEGEPSRRYGHTAVCLEHNVLVLGGEWRGPSFSEIWMYNLYTEQWRKHIPRDKENTPDAVSGACSVVINSVVYSFGGGIWTYISRYHDNALWSLKIKPNGYIAWSRIFSTNETKAPSPRAGHCGWQYSGKLWVFGGYGPPVDEYLNGNGYFILSESGLNFDGYNNQLLCFDPSSEEWTNPKCAGSIPTPRENPAAAISQEKVWLFGGCCDTDTFDDLYELNMHSLVWAQIQTADPKPRGRCRCTFNVISDSALVLHGGSHSAFKTLSDTWILDLKTQIWRQYTSTNDHTRSSHTGTTCLNGSVVIIGGGGALSDRSTFTTTFHVKMEPKSLQQLAMQTIYAHRTQLPWKHLPKKLINLLGLFESEDTKGDLSVTSSSS